jgi:hypothetical protein
MGSDLGSAKGVSEHGLIGDGLSERIERNNFHLLEPLAFLRGRFQFLLRHLGNLHADSSRSLFTPNRRFSSQESVRSPRRLVLPDQWHRRETSV